MDILFVAGFGSIVAEPSVGIEFYRDTLGLPLEPSDIGTPQATIEFEVPDVEAAADELVSAGHTLLHDTRTEPWGQTIARVLGPEGLLIGLCHTPWLHDLGED